MGVPRGFYPPAYTASLDAAMILVPEGKDWMVDNFDGNRTGFRCSACVYGAEAAWVDSNGAATPALALLAAALRAQSEMVA